jgi:hypothetical protein
MLVGKHELGLELGKTTKSLEAVSGGLDVVTFGAQELGERGARPGLVVDDQDPSLAHAVLSRLCVKMRRSRLRATKAKTVPWKDMHARPAEFFRFSALTRNPQHFRARKTRGAHQ